MKETHIIQIFFLLNSQPEASIFQMFSIPKIEFGTKEEILEGLENSEEEEEQESN